jgi:general secretion pathway protein I
MNRRAPPPRGFGLLEALVALAIFSLAGLSLFSWINNNLAAASRVRDREAEMLLARQALAWMQTIDPLKQPDGEAEPAPGLRVRWRAEPLSPLTAVAPFPGGSATPFRVRLYEFDITVQAANGPAVTGLKLTRTGVERDPAGAPEAASPR